MKFVSTHHHTTFSYQDGYGTPEDHAKRTAELGMSALAVTDHGNNSAHVGLEKAALKYGIKPLFGLEAYTALRPKSDRKFHLTLLAMNEGGYRNLNKIITQSWQDFHRWPTVLGRTLAKYHEGLIVLSGCSDSILSCSLLGGKDIDPSEASWERGFSYARRMKDLLGDRFYLECQMFPELKRTRELNPAFEEMGNQLGIPLVATADVHTLRPGDSELRALLHAAGRGNNTIAKQLSSWEYDVPDYIPMSDRAVYRAMLGTGLSPAAAREACRSTIEIAERCNVNLPKARQFRYPCADPVEELWAWLREGWRYRVAQGNRRMVDHKEEYEGQIRMEMERILEKGFESYFLLASDLIKFAKSQGIAVGPGRGSSAASVVCYLLRITEPDPLAFPLTDFSRFVDPTRVDLPDIDTDFDDSRRHEVRAYAVKKFGADNVANIGTFTKYKGKNSLDDVARVYQIPKGDIEVVKGMIVERSGGDSRADASLQDTFEMFPSAQAILDKHPKISQAIRLEGNYKGMSVHAAGIVISDRPISDVCAMYTREDKKTGEILTAVSVNKYDAEYLKLMKFDLLGLLTMGMISDILKMVGMSLDELYAIPYDDPKTLKAFEEADVVGVFQFEGRATRLVCRDIRPETFLDLIDINALSRPGPLFSGTTAEYIDVKHGRRQPTRVHPIIDRIAKGTRGQIIYQEQILHALAEFGGLSVQRVHEIRRIISQKLGEAQFNTSAEAFAENAMKLHGVTRETAMKVWERVVTSASYAFVYSHSLAYTIIGYWCMYFKMHHPAAFYAAQLGKVKKEKWPRLIKDAERHGVKVHGVQPGVSGMGWTYINDYEIAAGWVSLEQVGPSKAQAILDYLQGGNQIRQVDDLLKVKGIGPAILAKLRNQMEGDDPFGLRRIERALEGIRLDLSRGDIPLAPPTCRSDDILELPGDTEVIWVGMVRLKEFKDFVEDERARSGRTPEEIRAEMWRPDLPTSCVLHCIDDGDEDVYVRIKRQDYPRFVSGLERIRVGVDVIWVRARKSQNSFGASLYVKELVVIEP